MPIQFRCECGKSYKVDDKHAGRSLTCKACGEPLMVPAKGRSSGGKRAATPKRGPAPPPLVSGQSKKKKKRRPADLDEPASSERALSPKMIAILVAPVVLVIGGIGYAVLQTLSSSGSGDVAAKAAAPVKMVKFQSEHGNFSVEHPEDWSAEGGGGTGGTPPRAMFKSGDAILEIRASRSGVSIGDIAGAGGGLIGEELPEDLEPVAKVHEFQKMKAEANYNDYEETPGKTIELPYGDGRISTFTGDEGLLGSNVKGYRVTLIGNLFQYNVTAKCPVKQWDDYSATFQKMIESIDR